MCDSPTKNYTYFHEMIQQRELDEPRRRLSTRRSPSTSSSSSSNEDEPAEKPRTNDVEQIAVNGKGKAEVSGTKEEAENDGVHCDPGMKSGLQHLYSGKEDKKGRFQWQDKIPEDIGDPVENDETAKWALLVRNVKVYNDPTRVLSVHSIVVQSPLLKTLLAGVLKNYPGVTVGLNRLEFSGKFEPLIHRWTELQEAIGKLGDETEDQQTTKAHAELLQEVLVKEFKSMIDTSQDMKSKRVMTYEHLWTLFQPGATVFSRQDGQETAMVLVETRYGQDAKGTPCFWLTCRYVDWDGSKFGTQKINLSVSIYTGTRSISSLRVYPLEYHPEGQAIRTRLIERGTKAEALAGPNYRAYQGVAWRQGAFGAKDKYNVKGRIVIDTYGWNRFNPTHLIFVAPLNQKEPTNSWSRLDGDPIENLFGDGGDDEENRTEVDDYDEDDSGMPMDGHFADEEDAAKHVPLTTEQKLICTPLLRGYSLKNKLWLNFFVNCVKDIEWQKDAFDRLVLPKNQKELILGFTESQRKFRDTFDDVIEGKGKGMIILLCGPPGVGKTLTSESVAEEMKVPLYMMSAGDLGFDPRKVETKLQDILEMCSRWNAVLLLDEADVFLEQRSLHELERNKLVSIFLRVLEYYEGTMFLTTNRVQTFDPAFQSRIHISLDYQELSVDSRKMIWTNFLDSTSAQDHSITAPQLHELARMNMNGRQIKNILKIARLLASRKEEKLSHEHIVTTMEVTQHLHNETQFTDRMRGSLYG
ncbi:P-loop containing nucleoside triphosphate hydrolase protein [Cucurbitaria berberidis CBS 394.84]|uniref:P-loop containing nucleoside triphosphate hydrolase protein n=1 Tax=Cucurbitaria berberidis CBS 394.84 TaxID=1168544 RepID=A0A9P4GHN8_9PLEO|nr:P-loop containing nucleoside triphosphate hydrolase protein [Cucurbitaria berberidis CBS 394.84]KAF1846343.1 P-loop containing nucleoside triphosphate hydrolase protein [Cucurbitaria berberidis CBS 394.84]